MDITDIIAFFAFIVALYGAILSTYTAINEFFRLNLLVFNSKETYITLNKKDGFLSEYGEYISTFHKDLYTLAILVRITNKSKNTTTINEIVLNNKYIIDSSCKIDTLLPVKFANENGFIISWEDKVLQYPAIKPLLEIKPLTSYEGYLIFNNVRELPSKFNITINTVQKSKTFHLKLSISNDYRISLTQESL